MPWTVSDSAEDVDNVTRYEDYETTDALAEFFRRVSERETAILEWSY